MNKDLKIIIGGRVLQIIIMLVSIRLLTTYLSPEEIGNYYIILAFLAFFNLVLLNPPGMYLGRHLLHWQESKNLFNGIFVFIVWIIIVAILSIPISIFVYYSFGYETKFDLGIFVAYTLISLIISTIHRNVMYGTNTLGYRKEFVVYLISTLLLGLICSVSIVYFYYNFALGWVLGVVVSEFLMLYVVFKFFIQNNVLNISKIKSTLSKERLTKILQFSLPIGLTTFLYWGQNTAYRFLIDYQYSAEILGFIAVGLGVSTAVFSAIESISIQYFNPIFLKNILNASKDERAIAWNNIAKLIVPIYILTALFTIAMSEVLVSILLDQKFHDAYIYTIIGVGIEFFRVMTSLVYNISQSEYKTTYTIKPYILGFIISLGIISIVNFGTNYYMIPTVLVVAYFSVFLSMYKNMKKLLDINIEVEISKILLLSLPFLIIYYIDVASLNMLSNLSVLFIFIVYFLCIIWFEVRKIKIKGLKNESI